MKRRTLLLALLLVVVGIAAWSLLCGDGAPGETSHDTAAAAPRVAPGDSGSRAAGPKRQRAPRDGDTKLASLTVRLVPALESDPLAGVALVSIRDAENTSRHADATSERTVVFEGLPAGRVAVHASCERRRTEMLGVDLAEGERGEIRIVLTRSCELIGVVRDPTGAPVPGARVQAEDSRNLGYVGSAGPDGRFAIQGLAPGTVVTLRAQSADWADAAIEGIVVNADGTPTQRDIVLRQMASLAVKVFDPSGEQVEARVRLDSRASVSYDPARREHVVERIQPGRHTVTASLRGSPATSKSMDLPAGERTVLEMFLVAAVEITGVVVDETGAPVSGATVTLDRPVVVTTENAVEASAPPRRSGTENLTWSGADGAFRVGDLAKGPFVLRAETADRTGDWMQVNAPAEAVRLVVVPRTKVRFRLASSASGVSISNVVAGVCPAGTPPNSSRETASRGASEQGRVGPDHVFEFEIAPDARALYVGGDGFAPLVVPISPAERGVLDLGEIRVEAGITLRGRVVTTNGAGVEYSSVYGGARSTQSAADGSFALEQMAPGPAVVRVSAYERMGAATVLVEPKMEPVSITAPLVGSVRASLRDEAGKLVIGVSPVVVHHSFAGLSDDVGLLARPLFLSQSGTFNVAVAAGRVVVSFGDETVTRDVPEAGEVVVDFVKR